LNFQFGTDGYRSLWTIVVIQCSVSVIQDEDNKNILLRKSGPDSCIRSERLSVICGVQMNSVVRMAS
jgi:hypothetical protein